MLYARVASGAGTCGASSTWVIVVRTIRKLSMRAVLDEAWDALAPRHREQITKSHMAQCVLRHAAAGERDPGRLRFRAIADAVQELAA
jgi:hypothetical protein